VNWQDCFLPVTITTSTTQIHTPSSMNNHTSFHAIPSQFLKSYFSYSRQCQIFNRPLINLKLLAILETWSLTLGEEHRLRVFENTMFRRIFGSKRDEVTGCWRKLHNEELHGLYSSPSIMGEVKRCIQHFG
jgi:hypothetical protein